MEGATVWLLVASRHKPGFAGYMPAQSVGCQSSRRASQNCCRRLKLRAETWIWPSHLDVHDDFCAVPLSRLVVTDGKAVDALGEILDERPGADFPNGAFTVRGTRRPWPRSNGVSVFRRWLRGVCEAEPCSNLPLLFNHLSCHRRARRQVDRRVRFAVDRKVCRGSAAANERPEDRRRQRRLKDPSRASLAQMR